MNVCPFVQQCVYIHNVQIVAMATGEVSCQFYSKEAASFRSGSIDSPLRLRSMGSSRTSIPGPAGLAPRRAGKTWIMLDLY